MKAIALEDTTLTVEQLAKIASKQPVILTRKGKPVAAVKDLSGSDWEAVALANNPRFVTLIENSRRSYREKGGITIAEVRRRLGLKAPKDPGFETEAVVAAVKDCEMIEKRNNRLAAFALVVPLLAIVGCGKAMHPVRGQLVWSDGTPARELAGGSVGFNSDSANLSARGEIQADGSFSLSSLKKDDGLPPGRYRVMIAPPEPVYGLEASGATDQARELLSEKYQSYETSGLEAAVEAKENQLTLTLEKDEPPGKTIGVEPQPGDTADPKS